MKRAGLIFLCLWTLGCVRQSQPQITYGNAPDFSLTERSGKTISSKDLSGQVWVADFIFTSCAGTCPLVSGKMRDLQQNLPSGIRLVSFSVDPERDTPAVLAEYAKKYNADPDRWLFLTGQKEVMHDLSVKGFKLALDYEGGTDTEPITHSTRFVLVDQKGTIRGYYGADDDDDMKRLLVDAKKLL